MTAASPARPPKKGQFDPFTSTSSKDCVAAVVAYLIWRATGGKVTVSHAEVRLWSGAPSTRGLTMTEGQKAARHWGVELGVAQISGEVLWQTVKGGASVGVIVHCPPWLIFTGSAYQGNHEMYLHAAVDWPKGEVCTCDRKTALAHREYTVEDPGSKSAGYLQRSEQYVLAGARKASGGTNVWTHVGPDTEGVERKSTARVRARVSPSTASAPTRWIEIGQVVFVKRTLNGADGRVWVELGKGDYMVGSWLR